MDPKPSKLPNVVEDAGGGPPEEPMVLRGKWEEVGEPMGSFSSSSWTACIPAVEDWNGDVVPGKVLAIVFVLSCECESAGGVVMAPRVGLCSSSSSPCADGGGCVRGEEGEAWNVVVGAGSGAGAGAGAGADACCVSAG